MQATIENRKSKGQGIVSEILSIIEEIWLGKHTTTVGLKLREVMLLNGILFNSEAWHGVTKNKLNHWKLLINSCSGEFSKHIKKHHQNFCTLKLVPHL